MLRVVRRLGWTRRRPETNLCHRSYCWVSHEANNETPQKAPLWHISHPFELSTYDVWAMTFQSTPHGNTPSPQASNKGRGRDPSTQSYNPLASKREPTTSAGEFWALAVILGATLNPLEARKKTTPYEPSTSNNLFREKSPKTHYKGGQRRVEGGVGEGRSPSDSNPLQLPERVKSTTTSRTLDLRPGT